MFTESSRICCSFSVCCSGSANHRLSLIMALPTFHPSCCVCLQLVEVTSILPHTLTFLSGGTCRPVIVKYQDINPLQAMEYIQIGFFHKLALVYSGFSVEIQVGLTC